MQLNDPPNQIWNDQMVFRLPQNGINRADDQRQHAAVPAERIRRLEQRHEHRRAGGSPWADKRNNLQKAGCNGQHQRVLDAQDRERNIGQHCHDCDQYQLTANVRAQDPVNRTAKLPDFRALGCRYQAIDAFGDAFCLQQQIKRDHNINQQQHDPLKYAEHQLRHCGGQLTANFGKKILDLHLARPEIKCRAAKRDGAVVGEPFFDTCGKVGQRLYELAILRG